MREKPSLAAEDGQQLQQEVLERFAYAAAAIAFGDVTASLAHGVLHGLDRVPRARWIFRVTTVEHGNIVEVIAGGEGLLARNFEQPLQFREGRAFMVIRVAKTQVNGVVLVVEFWMRGARFVDEFDDARHFFLVLRDQTLRAVCVVQDARACFAFYELDHLCVDRRR